MATTARACNAGRGRAAFTLLEVVIAMAILVMVLMICYQILGSTLDASDQIDRKTRPDKIGDAIMGTIRRDLQGVVWYGLGEDVFRGDDGGVGETARDEMHFFTTTRPVAIVQGRLGGERWWTGVTSVSYVLHQSREVDGCYVLLRRESAEIAENPFETGTYSELYGKMKFLDILYFDGYEWAEGWNSLDRIEYYRTEVQLLSEQAAGEASSVTARTRDAGAAAAAASAKTAPGAAAARNVKTAGGAAARGTDAAGETLALTPLPERGIPRAVRVTFGLLAGVERGLFKESAAPGAAEKVYVFSATIALPAATSTRITADVAALTPPAAVGGRAGAPGEGGLAGGGGAGGVGGVGGLTGKTPDGKSHTGKGREDLLKRLEGLQKGPATGSGRPASGGAAPAPKRMPGQKK